MRTECVCASSLSPYGCSLFEVVGRGGNHTRHCDSSDTDSRLFRIKDINTHCLEQFRAHWECLDDNNHQMWQCRPAEWKLNKCVFEKLVRRQRSEALLLEFHSDLAYADVSPIRVSRRSSPTNQRTRFLSSCGGSRSSHTTRFPATRSPLSHPRSYSNSRRLKAEAHPTPRTRRPIIPHPQAHECLSAVREEWHGVSGSVAGDPVFEAGLPRGVSQDGKIDLRQCLSVYTSANRMRRE